MDSHIDADLKAYAETYQQALEDGFSGMVALIHDGQLHSVYDELSNAYHTGCANFGEGTFTLVNIGEEPAELGAVGIGLT